MRRKADQLIPFEVALLEAAVASRRSGEETFHGYSLAKTIQTSSNRRTLTAHGTLYRALHRLERAGLVEGFWEDPAHAAREDRPRRKLYRLTALAEPALSRARSERRTDGKLRSLTEEPGTG